MSRAPAAIDDADVQAIVRSGHGKLPRACFYVLRVRDAAAARTCLRAVDVSTVAARAARASTAIQVALTAPGMIELGVPIDIVAKFSPEFVAGMAGDPSRARRLGDEGRNASTGWRWGAGDRAAHVLVMLFSTPEAWPALQREIEDGGAWDRAFTIVAALRPADLDNTEPFGFRDGISQPEVDWTQTRPIRVEEPEYTNISAIGEFVLGFQNEYGKFTDRPLLGDDGGAGLPRAIDAPDMCDLGRHGTYLVMRDLRQDVRGFWRFVYEQSASAQEAVELAEAMVGRRMNGEPLATPAGRRIHGTGRTATEADLNQFTFDDDRNGERCPLGAHIRRSNPRNGDFARPVHGPIARFLERLGLPAHERTDDRIASTRFHRLLRRGRKFGPPLTPDAARQAAPPDDPERGLYFACINAHIARQFEFVQNAWLMSANFDGLCEERDPLLGDRGCNSRNETCDTLTVPRPNGASRRLIDVPQFVTVQGGGYFFLPGVRALRFLATAGGNP